MQQRRDSIDDLPNGNVTGLKVDDSVLAAGSMFKDDVRSSLPYVEVVTAEYRYRDVPTGEGRNLRLKVCSRIVLRVVSDFVDVLFFVFLQTSQEDAFRISYFDVHNVHILLAYEKMS